MLPSCQTWRGLLADLINLFLNPLLHFKVEGGTDILRWTYDVTAFNWGDMQKDGKPSSLGMLGERHWKMSPEDVKHYLRVISPPSTPGESRSSKVKLIFRGHQHSKQHYMHNGKVVVTTLPVGMDSPVYDHLDQLDTGYILTTGPKVKNWTKRAILRAPRSEKAIITPGDPLTSDKV